MKTSFLAGATWVSHQPLHESDKQRDIVTGVHELQQIGSSIVVESLAFVIDVTVSH